VGLTAAEVLAGADGRLGAYVHIPFCSSICPFCPYNKVLADDALARRYVAALCAEIGWYVQAAERAGLTPFTSLYLGGGTPTLYPRAIGAVIAAVPVSGERAVEVLPTHATPDRLDELAGFGVDSVSIGAQSFHDEVLRRLRRPHDAATARIAVSTALGRFDCVDVDLIVDVAWDAGRVSGTGLAGAFLADLVTCFELGVDQVSTYPLMRFGYTPFGTARHDRRREHAVLAEAAALAEAAGYQRRSVWTFNRRGSRPYTSITRRRYVGWGAGATSFTGRDYYVEHFGVRSYAQDVEQGRLPIARHLRLGRWGGAGYDAFWQAYAGGVDVAALQADFGPAVGLAARALLAPGLLIGDVRRTRRGVALAGHGWDRYHDLERAVTYHLIEPLWAQMLAEHARESPPSSCRARWARPERGRRSRSWALTCRAFERPVPP